MKIEDVKYSLAIIEQLFPCGNDGQDVKPTVKTTEIAAEKLGVHTADVL